MATLRQKNDGRFFIDYRDDEGRKRLNIQIEGKPVRDPIMAGAYFDHWMHQQKIHTDPRASRVASSPRIEAVVNYYLDVHLIANNAAEATHAAARTHCMAFVDWLRTEHIGRVQQINGEVLTRWIAYLQSDKGGRGARTARNYSQTIRAALNAAVDAEIIERNPVRKWTAPKVDQVEKHPLSLAELRELIGIFHDRPIVVWMCLTGQRPSDARALKFGDVDIPTRTVERRSIKVRTLRKFEICEEATALVAREALRRHRPEDCVFLSSHGRPWGADGMLNSIKDRLKQVEHPRAITPKMLRDSFGTIMANDLGMPLPELQILMGHTRIETTMQYVRARGGRAWLDALDKAISLPNHPEDGTTKAPPSKGVENKGQKRKQ